VGGGHLASRSKGDKMCTGEQHYAYRLRTYHRPELMEYIVRLDE